MLAGRRWRDHAVDRFGEGFVRATALRGVLVVAAVVIGAIIISNGFPKGGPGPTAGGTPPKTSSPSASKTPSPTPTTPQCVPQGVEVAVENGTDVTGLAAATAATLQTKGYVPGDIGNAPTTLTTTVVYYNGPDNMFEAKCLRKKVFTTAVIKSLPEGTGLPVSTDVAVYLGDDYASEHPVT
jgi:hypothetical protein